jgi:hypothetical protein
MLPLLESILSKVKPRNGYEKQVSEPELKGANPLILN